MGLVSDIGNAISDFFKGILVDGIESSMETSFSVLQGGLTSSRQSNGIIDQFLGTNPVDYTGGGTHTIWSDVQTICENAVVPVAAVLLTIILVTDLIQMVVSGNNFRDFDNTILLKWIIKAVCGIVLVSNVFYIATGIFSIGTWAANKAMRSLGSMNIGSGRLNINPDNYGFGELLVVLLLSFLLVIIMYVTIAIIVVALCSRMIEIFMYLGASPLPMATFMNPEWKQMGHNWIRGMLALAFQGLFIIIALTIFTTLFRNAIQSLNNGQEIVLQMAFLFGYALAMIFTILRSGQISKSIFGAH